MSDEVFDEIVYSTTEDEEAMLKRLGKVFGFKTTRADARKAQEIKQRREREKVKKKRWTNE